MVNPQLPPTAPMSGSTAACPRAVAANEPLGSDTQQLFLAAVPKKNGAAPLGGGWCPKS